MALVAHSKWKSKTFHFCLAFGYWELILPYRCDYKQIISEWHIVIDMILKLPCLRRIWHHLVWNWEGTQHVCLTPKDLSRLAVRLHLKIRTKKKGLPRNMWSYVDAILWDTNRVPHAASVHCSWPVDMFRLASPYQLHPHGSSISGSEQSHGHDTTIISLSQCVG